MTKVEFILEFGTPHFICLQQLINELYFLGRCQALGRRLNVKPINTKLRR